MKTIRKIALTWAIAIFTTMAAVAQTGRISGTITQSVGEENLPIAGATVMYYPVNDTLNKKGVISGQDGKFTIPALPYGSYVVNALFLGMSPIAKDVKLDKSVVEMGEILLSVNKELTREVVIGGMAIRTSVKGDTVAYNADAYKVTADASASDLLKKMPGITVENGKVEAGGETVQKVLVDGKEFYGTDVSMAINNLPADAISSVQSFTKKSDEAEFSGVEDGQGYRALNFITKEGISKMQFGKFEASYGFDDKYFAGATYGNKVGDRLISVVGFSNNVNRMNFSAEDITTGGGPGGGMFYGGGASGVNTAQQLGVNYGNIWKENKFKLDASYTFNNVDNNTSTQTARDYFMSNDETRYSYSDRLSNSLRSFHTANANFKWKIDSNNEIQIRPSIRLQGNDSSNQDSSIMRVSSSVLQDAIVNMGKSISSTDATGFSVSNSINYMHKVGGRAGRVLSVNLSGNYSKNDSYGLSNSKTLFYEPGQTTPYRTNLLDQKIDGNSIRYGYSARVMYTEPISTKVNIFGQYRISYDYSDNSRISNLWDSALNDYFISDSLSNVLNNDYIVHRAGPGVSYNTDKTNLTLGAEYQYSTRDGEQTRPALDVPFSATSFENMVYNASLRYKFNQSNNMSIDISSSTNNPSIRELQGVLDVTDPLNISQGNPNLKTAYRNQGYLRFTSADVARGRTFSVNLNGGLTSNYIVSSIVIADQNNQPVYDQNGNVIVILDQGATYSRPENINGNWNMGGFMRYSFPVTPLRSNVSVNTGYFHSTMPGIFNMVENTTNTNSYNAGVHLSSNISTKLDFMVGYSFGYNTTRNIQRPQANENTTRQFVFGNLKWVTWQGITLSANGTYVLQRGITSNFTNETLMATAAIGKKLFKNQRGELSLALNDIFNQSESFYRATTENYVQTTWTNTIGRYVSLNFVYNLRKYNGKGEASIPTSETPDSLRPSGGPGMRPGGGPGGPGGGRPM